MVFRYLEREIALNTSLMGRMTFPTWEIMPTGGMNTPIPCVVVVAISTASFSAGAHAPACPAFPNGAVAGSSSKSAAMLLQHHLQLMQKLPVKRCPL